MKTVKITKTETYKDSQGEHIVCKGKLILLTISDYGTNPNKAGEICEFPYGLNITGKADMGYPTIKPIIVSETEKIEVKNIDNQIYDAYLKKTIILTQELFNIKHTKQYFKILALPENFSSETLKDIVDGKLKDGDEVLIECDAIEIPSKDDIKYNTGYGLYVIKLNKDNHIKLFPINKEESWDDWFTEVVRKFGAIEFPQYSDKLSIKHWLEKNYNAPTKIN